MKKNIAKTLKRLRNESGYSVEQVSELLKKEGLKISPNTIYNYENEVSQPKADMLVLLCKIYKVTDFDIFLDAEHKNMPTLSTQSTSTDEQQLLTKYRRLNDRGREKVTEYVDDLLDNEKYTCEQFPDEESRRA